MKNKTKLERVKRFLEANNIEYQERTEHKWGGSDLFLPKHSVSIKIEGDDDQVFFLRHRKGRYPVFIRNGETPKFVIEKIQNTIIKSMMYQQDRYSKNISGQARN